MTSARARLRKDVRTVRRAYLCCATSVHIYDVCHDCCKQRAARVPSIALTSARRHMLRFMRRLRQNMLLHYAQRNIRSSAAPQHARLCCFICHVAAMPLSAMLRLRLIRCACAITERESAARRKNARSDFADYDRTDPRVPRV